MTAFKQIMLNGSLLKEVPFRREFELQGYLIAHPELLSLVGNNDNFKVKDVLGVERPLKDGRVDMVVEYDSNKIAIVELKRREIVEKDYKQIGAYLNNLSKVREWSSLQDYKEKNEDFDKQISERNMFGVLVGPSFSKGVLEMLRKRNQKKLIITGLTIKRYKAADNEYLITETISNFTAKDFQQYFVDGEGPFGKGRMVLAAIREFVAKNKDVTYDELTSDDKFPASLRGTSEKWGCVSLLEAAKRLAEQTGYKRHFLDENDVIVLKGGVRVVVSSQWGIGNINAFIKRAKKLGIKIDKAKSGRKIKGE